MSDNGADPDPLEELACLRENCPVRQDAEAISRLGTDMVRRLRRLRRNLRRCHRCPQYGVDGCDFLRQFNALVQTAVSEVMAEWER